MKTTQAKKRKSSNPIGRPPIVDDEALRKLEEVFAIGGTDEEACFYADIGKSTLYKYQAEHPEFIERKEALKHRPILKARQTVIKALDDVHNAQWYLERKRKVEFANRQEHSGPDGEKLRITFDTALSHVISPTPEGDC